MSTVNYPPPANDWDVKIKVQVAYPSEITGTGGLYKEISLVEEIDFTSSQPIEIKPFINEFNALTIWKQPVYTGTIRIASNSYDLPNLRKYLHNRSYFDVMVIEDTKTAGIKGSWKAQKELFIGAVFTEERGAVTAENLPVREFAFQARYRGYAIRDGSTDTSIVGDGWAETGETLAWDVETV